MYFLTSMGVSFGSVWKGEELRGASLTQATGKGGSVQNKCSGGVWHHVYMAAERNCHPDSGTDGILAPRTRETWFYLHFGEVKWLSFFLLKPFLSFLFVIPNGQCLSPAHALCSRKQGELLAYPWAQLKAAQDLWALCSIEEENRYFLSRKLSVQLPSNFLSNLGVGF